MADKFRDANATVTQRFYCIYFFHYNWQFRSQGLNCKPLLQPRKQAFFANWIAVETGAKKDAVEHFSRFVKTYYRHKKDKISDYLSKTKMNF